MYSPHRHPILGPWSLQSVAPVPPPLPQVRPVGCLPSFRTSSLSSGVLQRSPQDGWSLRRESLE